MKTRDDFKLDLDFTLRDLIEDELLAESVEKKQPPQFTDESIEALMQAVYSKIERGALEAYKSNEPWALRRWALENILRGEIVSEATVEIANGLIAPVLKAKAHMSVSAKDCFNSYATCLVQTATVSYQYQCPRCQTNSTNLCFPTMKSRPLPGLQSYSSSNPIWWSD